MYTTQRYYSERFYTLDRYNLGGFIDKRSLVAFFLYYYYLAERLNIKDTIFDDTTLTGHMRANINKGIVESASSQCTPSVGITTSARATSRHAPSAQKH